ncbi:hypothetical protein CsSME_00011540 [Camellia sinensis var. sinensis]
MTTYHQIIIILMMMMSPLKGYNCLAFGQLGMLLPVVRFGFVAYLPNQVRAFGMLVGGTGITPTFILLNFFIAVPLLVMKI